MEYHDKVLKCSECSQEFVFTAGEQTKRSQVPGQGNLQRSETKTTCSQCGKETTVPFRPTQGRPVFCRECFQQRRSMGGSPA